ncbi:Inherit from COG: esterase [Seminavis robusta]|uniref:Inherit from COG: esterase n=1 Tax=Seminavis robusta TaxID=568900 RepID=A0A9N8HRT4_9STRA|nr:Inherit from COG: esterase [Seminavis robusta]|eukprot:Sro1308_g261480.1 Inherit from COG: esterase (332) ;mRNA; f:17124-18119
MRGFLSAVFLFISDDVGKYNQEYRHQVPVRPLTPPFPDGLCGGRVVTIPPEETYAIDVNFNNVVLPPRAIDVWLPPEYDQEEFVDHNFPLLFCHDGQNAMEDASSWTGASWRMMGALTRLSERNLLRYPTPPIVVLLQSSQDDLLPGVVRRRHLEYSDTANRFAKAHVDFVAKTVLPYLHVNFRASQKASDTHVIGSSLGGQASFHMLLRYPELFGGAGCMSPAFQPPTLAMAATQLDKLRDKRIYMDIGGDIDQVKVSWFDVMDHLTGEHWWNPGYWWLDTQLAPSVDAMSWALKQGNVPHSYKKFAGGRHNERAWSLRIHQPLLYLLGK